MKNASSKWAIIVDYLIIRIFNEAMHKKIYYTPGLISLIGIPLLLVYYGSKQLSELKKTVFEVYWYNKSYWDTTNKIQSYISYNVPNRRILELEISGKIDEDEIKLKFGELYIKEIIAKKDTVHAVNFHLGNEWKYSMLVRILDMCTIHEVDFFAPSNNGVLMYYEYPPRENPKKNIEVMPL